ncbi:unnamed protein product [Polarella glacialis]|uniref:Uncharacterized protein n=1 Tax=Polarella glacialis TaxID=89957 RepID=A0A813HGZ2_POLGL|nr:unnamed protein product [Polarella glacialis]CAE8637474.1 unnamed protein product [Polarella glacialis]
MWSSAPNDCPGGCGSLEHITPKDPVNWGRYGEPAVELGLETGAEDITEEVVVRATKISSLDGETSGRLLAPKAGVVVLRWSNGHNILRSKAIHFKVALQEA